MGRSRGAGVAGPRCQFAGRQPGHGTAGLNELPCHRPAALQGHSRCRHCQRMSATWRGTQDARIAAYSQF